MRKFVSVALCWIMFSFCGVVNVDAASHVPDTNSAILSREEKIAHNDEFDKGSGINLVIITPDNLENLYQLGKLWGYLKYYHPDVAKGDYNWDYELFRILPAILNAKTSQARDELFCLWLDSLGEYEPGLGIKSKAALDGKLRPNLAWISGSTFSEELTERLRKIETAARRNDNFYVTLTQGVGNPSFNQEKTYLPVSCPDTGYRLLALFRYWNIIEYFFPYKYLIDEDWNDVLREFIPCFIEAGNKQEYNLTVLELVARIHDGHASMYSKYETFDYFWGKNSAPAIIQFIDDLPMVVGHCDPALGVESNLEIGDIIVSIDDVPVEEIVAEKIKYISASNYPGKLYALAPKLLRTNASYLNIEFERDKEILVIKEICASYLVPNVERHYRGTLNEENFFRMIDSDIACIYPAATRHTNQDDNITMISETKGLIIDLRCHPSETLVWLLEYCLPRSMPFAKFTNGSIIYPGLFMETDRVYIGPRGRNYDCYKGQVVILVNERTMSSAEFHAMMLKTVPQALIVGGTTAGADGNISSMNLPGGITTYMSGIGVYYPDGGQTQRIGIVPDIRVEPSIEGIKEGRDEVLEKALELIRNEK